MPRRWWASGRAALAAGLALAAAAAGAACGGEPKKDVDRPVDTTLLTDGGAVVVPDGVPPADSAVEPPPDVRRVRQETPEPVVAGASDGRRGRVGGRGPDRADSDRKDSDRKDSDRKKRKKKDGKDSH